MNITAISLWEPWASLIRYGSKTVETRGWSTNFRGPLLICAAKRWSKEQYEYLHSVPVQNRLWRATGRTPTEATDMLFGKAVAVANLVDVASTDSNEYADLFGEQGHFGNFGPGRFGWVLKDIVAIRPFTVRGSQGLFRVELPVGGFA